LFKVIYNPRIPVLNFNKALGKNSAVKSGCLVNISLISIRDAVVIKGGLPARQLKLVLAWCEIHQEELSKNWHSAQEKGKIAKIEPLR
jgi:hypothetical protein